MSDANVDFSEHDPNDELKCPYCHRQFENVDELTLHVVTRHSSQRGLPAEVIRQVRQLRETENGDTPH